MGIRRDHVHEDGKVCFATRSHHPLRDAGLFRLPGGVEFTAGYMGYTGQWYAFDPGTGKQIAQFHPDFFKPNIEPYRTASLVEDPTCVPV